MGKDLVNQLSILTNSYSHSFLLGCSGKYTSRISAAFKFLILFSFFSAAGCGKSSACLALAREKYVIYLEVPGGGAEPSKLRGFRMSPVVWSSASGFFMTTLDVRGALYAEVAARLVVLHHLLQRTDAKLTPLRWLLFTMSQEGSMRIGHVVDSIVEAQLHVLPSHVDRLLRLVTQLISDLQPVLVVDELQVLLERSVVDHAGERMSLMRAAVDSACLLSFSVVWSGTRLHVMAAMSKTSAFAKSLPNTRQLHIVGNFQYLESDDVRRLLCRVLPLASLAPATVSRLCYALQGRARTCAGFISHLLTRGCPAMQPGAVLGDDVVMDVYEDFLSKVVLSRVGADLASYSSLPQSHLSKYELGYLFCCTLLPSMNLPGDPVDRQNCIAFTECVKAQDVDEAQDAVGAPKSQLAPHSPGSPQQVRYSFKYRYGEPTLQEALLRFSRKDGTIADRGICKMLSSALAPSALGQYLDYAVVLSLLCRGSLALSALVAETDLEKYSTYTLSLDRVVYTSKAEDQLEWFRRVLDDPDDCSFSLLPGVPVKKIILLPSVLSGADGICVALPSGQQQSAEHPVTATRKRKDSPLKQEPDVVFVHICCATYDGGVTREKHESQLLKSGDQFSQVSEKKCKAAKRYKEVAQGFAEAYDVIPVLVEIPGNYNIDPTKDKDVVMVTDAHKGLQLLSQDAIDVLKQPRSASAPSGGPKG